MKRRYFVGGQTLAPGERDFLATYVEADSFEEATELAHEAARRRFPGRPYRLTTIAEYPELVASAPRSLAFNLTQARREHIIGGRAA